MNNQAENDTKNEKQKSIPEEKTIETKHSIKLNGKNLNYTVRAGTIILKEEHEEEGEKHVIKGADEYQLMVEHFSDAILGRMELDCPPDESIANMRVLDALSEAAQNGNTVEI